MVSIGTRETWTAKCVANGVEVDGRGWQGTRNDAETDGHSSIVDRDQFASRSPSPSFTASQEKHTYSFAAVAVVDGTFVDGPKDSGEITHARSVRLLTLPVLHLVAYRPLDHLD